MKNQEKSLAWLAISGALLGSLCGIFALVTLGMFMSPDISSDTSASLKKTTTSLETGSAIRKEPTSKLDYNNQNPPKAVSTPLEAKSTVPKGTSSNTAASRRLLQKETVLTLEDTNTAVDKSLDSSMSSPAMPDKIITAAEVRDVREKLKQIALSFLNFHDRHRSFPPGRKKRSEYKLSWRVYLLPYLDQKPLYERFHFEEPWDSPHNLQLLQYMPEVYRTGSDESSDTMFQVITGPHTFFPPESSSRLQHARDGISNTLLLIHSGGMRPIPWTKPEDLVINLDNPRDSLGTINGRFEGVLADGSQISLPSEVEAKILSALITPKGNEILDARGLRRKYKPTTLFDRLP